MTTLQNFEAACVKWLENKEPTDAEFATLLSDAFSVLLGTQQRDIAAHLKIAESTVSRWVRGATCPHPLIQKKVVRDLLRRARSGLAQRPSGPYASVAVPLAAKSGH